MAIIYTQTQLAWPTSKKNTSLSVATSKFEFGPNNSVVSLTFRKSEQVTLPPSAIILGRVTLPEFLALIKPAPVHPVPVHPVPVHAVPVHQYTVLLSKIVDQNITWKAGYKVMDRSLVLEAVSKELLLIIFFVRSRERHDAISQLLFYQRNYPDFTRPVSFCSSTETVTEHISVPNSVITCRPLNL